MTWFRMLDAERRKRWFVEAHAPAGGLQRRRVSALAALVLHVAGTNVFSLTASEEFLANVVRRAPAIPSRDE